jgi:glycerol-3-phosphate acyltransferase PlsY
MLNLPLAAIWGYLVGAVPTGVIISRAMRGVDVRQHGSRHTGGLNVSRVTGFGGGALTAVGDLLLGVIAVAGAALTTGDPWASVAAGVMSIVGHNWSVFIGFDGGIGLSTLTGAVLYLSPWCTLIAMAILILLWIILTQALRVHRARATILAMLVVGPLLWALGEPLQAILLGALGGMVVIVKTIPDWARTYE